MKATADVTDDEVRRRAFELWEQRGCPDGYESEFWLQAEREQKGKGNRNGVSTNAASSTSGSGSHGPR